MKLGEFGKVRRGDAASALAEALKRHRIITAALYVTAEMRKLGAKNGLDHHPSGCLRKGHEAYAIARTHFPDILSSLTSKGALTYPALIKLQVASAKVLMSLAGTFQALWTLNISDDLADELMLISGDHPVGTLYAAKYSGFVALPTDEMKACWERGYRACFEEWRPHLDIGRGHVPNQTGRRSEKYWLTYEAWLNLHTDPSLKPKLQHIGTSAAIIEGLKRLGVVEGNNRLEFPKEKKPITLLSFESQLSGWATEFQTLAKP